MDGSHQYAGMLEDIQCPTLDYFLKETNPANGLVPDKSGEGSPASIAAVGLALVSYVVGAERGFITRADAANRVRTTLQFLWDSPQGDAGDATGHKGFFYHFLDMATGQRVLDCELSTIDTTLLMAGALAAAQYFDRATEAERQVRDLADALYRRVDWQWAQDGGPTVTHGWTPERGFLASRWTGYSEAILLYALALGSPTHPSDDGGFAEWTRSYRWRKLYGHDFVYAGPLFIHQLSHVWIDFRGIQDDYMRARDSDYFQNSRRATLAQQQYAIRNPKKFKAYSAHCWGITASDGPGPATRTIGGVRRRFYDYVARGIPNGPDDGTIAPWAAVASLPFAPEIVLPMIRHVCDTYPKMLGKYGFKCSFNPTFSTGKAGHWHSERYFGLDQGPVVLMIENYRSELVWTLMKRCPWLVTGLRRAGFAGGWLSGPGLSA